jgi:flagellar assembly factor FliW
MNSSAALLIDPVMIVHSDLLGPLTVSPEELISFPNGLFGFPECQSFALVPAARDGMFWLQSTDHGTLAFLLADPFLFFDGYVVDLAAADRSELEAEDAGEIAILAIVTLPHTREEPPTANLQGPLAFNLRARRAKQLAISDSEFGVRCPLDLSRAAGA